LSIPDETLSYIAGQIDSKIRDLEGALMRVEAFSSMTRTPISTSLAAEALKKLKVSGKSSKLTITIIQDKVAKYYHVTIADLKGKKRVKSIDNSHHIAKYLTYD